MSRSAPLINGTSTRGSAGCYGTLPIPGSKRLFEIGSAYGFFL